MIRSILVPLDGSRFAESALPLAVRLTRASHGNLRLLLAHETAPALIPAGESGWDVPEHRGNREKAYTYLAQTAGCLPASGKPIEYEMVDGEVGPALVERIKLTAPDLVVMATHGRGTFGRFWRGSIADYLIRHVTVPILLVRPDRRSRIGIGTGFRKILVPLDLSDLSDLILEPVKAVARITQAHLTLVHVVEPAFNVAIPSPPLVAPTETGRTARECERAQQHLDRVAAELRAQGFPVATQVLTAAGVARRLLEQLEEGSYDLVAMTTHGRGGVQRAVLGSVATRLVTDAPRPVLVLRPSA